MELLIKKILNEYVQTKINELDFVQHFEDRLKERIYFDKDYIVQKWTKTNNGIDRRNVGTYRLDESQNKIISDKIQYLKTVDISEDLTVGVQIYKFDVDLYKIRFFTKDDRYETMRDTLKEDIQSTLYLKSVSDKKDQESESIGDILFAIIKDNKAITTFLERSFNLNTLKEKKNLDFVVDIDELKNLKNT
jgi:hypothetical protein